MSYLELIASKIMVCEVIPKSLIFRIKEYTRLQSFTILYYQLMKLRNDFLIKIIFFLLLLNPINFAFKAFFLIFFSFKIIVRININIIFLIFSQFFDFFNSFVRFFILNFLLRFFLFSTAKPG